MRRLPVSAAVVPQRDKLDVRRALATIDNPGECGLYDPGRLARILQPRATTRPSSRSCSARHITNMSNSTAVGAYSKLLALLLLVASAHAEAKPWKGAELGSQQTFKYGAFEARVRAAEGSGMITAFFLWKYGSEVPGALWQEQDIEIFGRDGDYQTQLITPGKNGAQRTEHVVNQLLLSPAWTRYYTYRLEWTPNYLAFFVDGQEVRRETDAVEFAKFLDSSQAEAAQIRLSLWAADTTWSGSFDASRVPSDVFVNWVQTYSYTPGTGPNGSDFTPLWRDEFNTLDTSRWQLSNWTFDAAVNDYVPQNAAAKDGKLVLVLTSEQSTGVFPAPPADDGSLNPPPGPTGPWPLPFRIEAEAFARYSDTTPGNIGGACRNTDVDLEVTQDPNGGQCHVGWTDPGEWLEYDVRVAAAATFDLTLRVASLIADRQLHVEIDGIDVTGPLTVPANGWQAFADLTVPDVDLTAGAHVVRLAFDTGYLNVNYFEFTSTGESNVPPPACTPSTHTYEAETMSATTGGSAPGGWNLWSNGSLSTTHDFVGGDSIIRVSAYGQSAQGVWPHLSVRVGSQTIGDVSVSATKYTPYEFAYTALGGPQTVSVAFDNDYYANGQDRNLYIDSVSIDECFD